MNVILMKTMETVNRSLLDAIRSLSDSNMIKEKEELQIFCFWLQEIEFCLFQKYNYKLLSMQGAFRVILKNFFTLTNVL